MIPSLPKITKLVDDARLLSSKRARRVARHGLFTSPSTKGSTQRDSVNESKLTTFRNLFTSVGKTDFVHYRIRSFFGALKQ